MPSRDIVHVVDIAHQIKDLRDSRGVTQIQLAERTGMRQPAIARVERGEHVPTWRTLERLAEALNAELVVALVPIERQ